MNSYKVCGKASQFMTVRPDYYTLVTKHYNISTMDYIIFYSISTHVFFELGDGEGKLF